VDRGERRRSGMRITLVDRGATHVWKPLLHEVAAGRMDADSHDLDYPALPHWHGHRFVQCALVGLNRSRRGIRLDAVHTPEHEEVLPQRVMRYDTLVIALGSVSNDFGVPGVARHAISLDGPDDAERFHRRLLAACVRADARAAAGTPTQVHVVIIGAGATGVELAAEVRQTTRAHAGYGLDHLDPARNVRITVIEAAPRILPLLGERISTAATELLGKLDVAVRVGERVTGVDAEGVTTASGEFFRADLVVWAAGIMAPPVLRTLDGLEVNRSNQLVVGPTLQTTSDAAIYAFGDCAAAPWVGREPGVLLPPRGQVALQQADYLAKAIPARLDGKPVGEFRFHDFGSLVSLGELSAVGNLMGRLAGGSMMVQGLIARLMYAALYKKHQMAILGLMPTMFDTLSRWIRGRLEPRVKLH